MKFFKLLSIVISLSVMAGCLRPNSGVLISTTPISIENRSTQADQLWEAALNTLRHHQFRLDRVDRRAGIITTRPLTSQHLFEFWRHDVDTWYDLLESTLNPLRRKVEITIAKDENGLWSAIAVAVHKERLSSPDRQFNSSGATYQYFGNTLPSTTGKIRVTQEDDQWIEVGSDLAMENYFLRKILLLVNIPIESQNQAQSPPSDTP